MFKLSIRNAHILFNHKRSRSFILYEDKECCAIITGIIPLPKNTYRVFYIMADKKKDDVHIRSYSNNTILSIENGNIHITSQQLTFIK